MVNRSRGRPRLVVTADGKSVVGHAGSRALCDLAEVLGLRRSLSAAMASTKQRQGGHDRGQVLVDLAVMVADGGTAISDLVTLIDQPSLFGPVASVATAWRTLQAIDEAALKRLADARAEARAEAWAAGADPGVYVIDIDATLVESHSEKQNTAANYKHGFGFSPVLAYLDVTGEALAGLLRAGNAPAGRAEDLVSVLDAALTQLPVDPTAEQVTIRSDSAGHSHEFVDACRQRHVRFIVGAPLVEAFQLALWSLPLGRWLPAVSSDGMEDRDHAQVAEITDVIDLPGWPGGHPGYRPARRSPSRGPAVVHRYRRSPLSGVHHRPRRSRHRLSRRPLPRPGEGRRRICETKDTGLSNLPSHSFAINAAWLTVALIAHDLLVWLKLLCLDGEMAHACWRHRCLRMFGRRLVGMDWRAWVGMCSPCRGIAFDLDSDGGEFGADVE